MVEAFLTRGFVREMVDTGVIGKEDADLFLRLISSVERFWLSWQQEGTSGGVSSGNAGGYY